MSMATLWVSAWPSVVAILRLFVRGNDLPLFHLEHLGVDSIGWPYPDRAESVAAVVPGSVILMVALEMEYMCFDRIAGRANNRVEHAHGVRSTRNDEAPLLVAHAGR
jgi:hypothetical protein